MNRLSAVASLPLLILPLHADVDAREVTVTPLEDHVATPWTPVPRGAPDCVLGNDSVPTTAIPYFLLPPEEYRIAFDPVADCAVCPDEFQVTAIHMFLQVTAACSLTMAVNVSSASHPSSPDCAEPSAVMCESGPLGVPLPGAGLWDISLPLQCECLPVGLDYMLGVSILSQSCAATVPSLITDSSPSLCTNWNDIGLGWTDLVATYPSWPGNLIIRADGGCCGATAVEQVQLEDREQRMRIFPNPTSRSFTVSLALDARSLVDLRIYDVSGRRIDTLFSGPLGEGSHRISWDGLDAQGSITPPGTYFLRARANGAISTHKVVVRR